jgi:hypothetical protein
MDHANAVSVLDRLGSLDAQTGGGAEEGAGAG